MWLVVARLLQGAGAAVVVPGSLSLIARTLTEPARRATMIARWSTVAGSAALAGPASGGVLVDTLGWRSIFLVNLLLGPLALVLVRRSIGESADPDATDLDPVGQLLGI